MPNAISNFMGGISNGARQVILDPVVDLGSLAAKGINKGLDYVTGDNLSKEANKKIDTVANGMKQEATSYVDPTSVAGAIGEGIPIGLDNANIVLGTVELAKQIGKQGLKQLPKLLGKYQDAKDKKAQLKAAQEIRDYIQKQAKTTSSVTSDIPAYQQKAYANAARSDIPMETYQDIPSNVTQIFNNLTDQFRSADALGEAAKSTQGFGDMSRGVQSLKTRAVDEALNPSVKNAAKDVLENDLKTPLSKSAAKKLGVPYSSTKEIKEVQKTVNDIAKMSDKDFKKFMQSNESAAVAGYEPSWRDRDVEDIWHSGDLGKTKDQVIKNILYNHGFEQEGTLTNMMQSVIRDNAIKNNKNYRKWIKKGMKDNYDEAVYGTTRAGERAGTLSAAEAEAADIKAGEDAYKHYGDSAIWF